jgi:hypothetical protein
MGCYGIPLKGLVTAERAAIGGGGEDVCQNRP